MKNLSVQVAPVNPVVIAGEQTYVETILTNISNGSVTVPDKRIQSPFEYERQVTALTVALKEIMRIL